MNIHTSGAKVQKFTSPQQGQNSTTLSASNPSGWGKATVDTVAAHPFRAIADTVTLTSAIGNLAAADNSPTGAIFKAASIALTVGHGISAVAHGIGAAEAYYSDDVKHRGVTAVGDLLTCAGHGAQLAGAAAMGLGLVAFGAVVTSMSDFNYISNEARGRRTNWI